MKKWKIHENMFKNIIFVFFDGILFSPDQNDQKNLPDFKKQA